METITISKKKYQELRAAKARLDALSNVGLRKKAAGGKRKSFSDLIGILSDVKELKGKTSVEVQHMIPALWSKKYLS